MAFTIQNILESFDPKTVDNKYLVDQLLLNYVDLYDSYKITSNKNKFLKMLAKIEFIPDEIYIPLYMELAKIPEFWKILNQYNLSIISYLCYGYNNAYYDCLMELTKYPDLWKIKESENGHVPLHFLILSIFNYGHHKALPIIENLTQYTHLWAIKNNSMNTPLHYFCLHRNNIYSEILMPLIKNKELFSISNNNGITPLHYLATNKDKNLHKIMIFLTEDECLDLWTHKDDLGYTPLHSLCRNSNFNFDTFLCKMSKNKYLWKIQNNAKKTPNDIMREYLDKEYDII
jgi:hypothetical protein